MQQLEHLSELGVMEMNRVDAVVETLSALSHHDESLAEVAHDARNMVTALDLYCDLLKEPGVLAAPFAHYAGELKLVAAASRRLVEKLVAMDPREVPAQGAAHTVQGSAYADRQRQAIEGAVSSSRRDGRALEAPPSLPIDNLAEELLASRNLLSALAGPAISLTIDAHGGAQRVQMTSEDLTRILVNLVKNASEAMSGVGRVHLTLWESSGEPENAPWLILNVEDNGPGIPDEALEKIFEAGHSLADTSRSTPMNGGWPVAHRGLGLSITRNIVEAAGGLIHAANRDPVGACFQIELPVRNA
jgi:signal transduction histidine kinase